MYSNIGKKIRALALILAFLGVVVFLGLAASFLIPALSETEADLQMAGFECAAIFAVLALLSPLLSWILYGFGVLLDTQKQLLAQTNEIRNILKKTIANGATADETARKLAIELVKNGYAAGNGNSALRQAPVRAARPVIVEEEPAEEEYEEEYEEESVEEEYEETEAETEPVEAEEPSLPSGGITPVKPLFSDTTY